MSRSYKRTPCCSDNKNKRAKRLANQVIRYDKDFDLKGGSYKKAYPTWNICDYKWLMSWEEFWKSHCKRYDNPDKARSYKQWLKWYRNK